MGESVKTTEASQTLRDILLYLKPWVKWENWQLRCENSIEKRSSRQIVTIILNFTSLNRYCLIKQANRAKIESAVISLQLWQHLMRKNIKCKSDKYSTLSGSDIFNFGPSSKELHYSDNAQINKRLKKTNWRACKYCSLWHFPKAGAVRKSFQWRGNVAYENNNSKKNIPPAPWKYEHLADVFAL